MILILANLHERRNLLESREGRGFARERDEAICMREWWGAELYRTIYERERGIFVEAHELTGLGLLIVGTESGKRGAELSFVAYSVRSLDHEREQSGREEAKHWIVDPFDLGENEKLGI